MSDIGAEYSLCWVPVEECDLEPGYHIAMDSDGRIVEVKRHSDGTYRASRDRCMVIATHVLVNSKLPYTPCLDMLERDVVKGDMLWLIGDDPRVNRLFKHRLGCTSYTDRVRVPRPGEAVPNFLGWQKMCLAMQALGAKFDGQDSDGKWTEYSFMWSFTDRVERYRRNPLCKWNSL